MLIKGIVLGVLSVFALAWILFCFWVQPAVAQEQQACGPRRQVIERLKKNYGEVERGVGIEEGKNTTVMMLFVNDETKSWTLLRVQPELACGVASGSDFTLLFGKPV